MKVFQLSPGIYVEAVGGVLALLTSLPIPQNPAAVQPGEHF